MEEFCVIIGGGPSLINYDFSVLKNLDTIVVNQAIYGVPEPDYFITMDYTWLMRNKISVVGENRNWFLNNSAEKYFVLALGEDRLKRISENCCIDKQFGLKYDLSVFDNIIRPTKYGGFGGSFRDFHYGSDSGFSALQLAVILGYKKIYLLGFDFCTLNSETHFHKDYKPYQKGDYQVKLDEFFNIYPPSLKFLRENGIEVFSCSPFSKLNEYILYVNPEKIF